MDCERVRDRFSSLWEKELSPSEEKVLREHLSSCLKCQKEYEQFEKTMRWLHSAGEVEVPEEFRPGLYKKLEEKKKGVPGEKGRERWFHFPLSFKLPAQAVAMVAVVFLVLYLTRMIPTEGVRLKEPGQTSSSLSVQEKPEEGLTRSGPPPRSEPFDKLKAPSSIEGLGWKASPGSEGEAERRRSGSTRSEFPPSVREDHRPGQTRGTGREVEALAQKEVKDERSAVETPTEAARPKDIEKAKAPVPKEGQSEVPPVPQIRAEAKKSEAPARSAGVLGYKAVDSKGAATASVPAAEPGKIEKELAAPERFRVASKPPQEIVLKISDRKKAIPRLHALVQQFGGEVVTAEGDMFLASLPTGSFPEFEKELAGIRSSSETDQLVAKKQAAGSLSLEEEAKRKTGDKKDRGPAKLARDTENRTIIRILLVEESSP